MLQSSASPSRSAPGRAQALAQAMFSDVLGALRHDRRARRDRRDHRRPRPPSPPLAGTASIVLADTVQAGQSPAAQIGIRHALAHGFDRVALVPGDTPLLRAADARRPAGRGAARGVSVVPDRHGTGTNALVLTPPDAIEPSFGPGSRAPPRRARRGRRRAASGSTRWPRSRSTWTRPTTSRRCRPSWSSAAARRRPPAAPSVSSTAPAPAPVRAPA